jgi:hypothetical protein
MSDEWIIDVIARRMDDECGWSKASTVMNHYGWVDVVTHLFCEKGLRAALLQAYQPELVKAHAHWLLENLEERERASAYAEWKADSSLRGEVEDL